MADRLWHQPGYIVVHHAQIYVDGANVAARLKGVADPDGMCVSHTVGPIPHLKIGDQHLSFNLQLGDLSTKSDSSHLEEAGQGVLGRNV